MSILIISLQARKTLIRKIQVRELLKEKPTNLKGKPIKTYGREHTKYNCILYRNER